MRERTAIEKSAANGMTTRHGCFSAVCHRILGKIIEIDNGVQKACNGEGNDATDDEGVAGSDAHFELTLKEKKSFEWSWSNQKGQMESKRQLSPKNSKNAGQSLLKWAPLRDPGPPFPTANLFLKTKIFVSLF